MKALTGKFEIQMNASSSSFGNWVVRTSPSDTKYFWKMKEAIAYYDKCKAEQEAV